MRAQIAVVGDRTIPARDPKRRLALELGRALTDAGYRIVTGGLGDLPAQLRTGAMMSRRYSEGTLVALLPGFDPGAARARGEVVIATGLDHGRNLLVANSDAVVALGGGAGTLSEIAFAWMLHRPIIGYNVRGWSGKLAGTRIDERQRYAGIPDDQVYPVENAAEVVALLRKLLPKYHRRHRGIPPG